LHFLQLLAQAQVFALGVFEQYLELFVIDLTREFLPVQAAVLGHDCVEISF